MIRLWVWSYTAVNLLTTRNNDLVLELMGRNVADELVDVKFRLQLATERALLLELAKRAGFALVAPGGLHVPAAGHPLYGHHTERRPDDSVWCRECGGILAVADG